MISVKHLTKKYAGTLAVDDVSFDVNAGEVVGFLGPNGAGKSTTMRILSGYMPATGGEVRVAGFDVFSDSLEVRRRVGYLPENVSMYNEMRVDEYLRYRARLKGVAGGQIRRRMGAVKEQCGLESVGRRIIGHLSKGYRQRVGLADALVHDPELLILDEPTLGLDPNQIRQIRSLIRDLAKQHTVILSTHILPEVEMTCQRVLILNRGRIVASDAPEKLHSKMQARIVADVKGPRERIEEVLGELAGVNRIKTRMDGEFVVTWMDCDAGTDLRMAVFELAVKHGWMMRELRYEKGTLEDAFVALTRGDAA